GHCRLVLVTARLHARGTIADALAGVQVDSGHVVADHATLRKPGDGKSEHRKQGNRLECATNLDGLHDDRCLLLIAERAPALVGWVQRLDIASCPGPRRRSCERLCRVASAASVPHVPRAESP